MWPVQYFNLRQTPQLSSPGEQWRDVVGARLWVYLPALPVQEVLQDDLDYEQEQDQAKGKEHAWINLFYVSVDKSHHTFLTQERATKVGSIRVYRVKTLRYFQ